jgi:Golgi nucleoside diphosphatase
VKVSITNFRLSTDLISVGHLSDGDAAYLSLNDISYSNTDPLTIIFCSENKLQLILFSHNSLTLSEPNFLFKPIEEEYHKAVDKDTVLARRFMSELSLVFCFFYLLSSQLFIININNKRKTKEKAAKNLKTVVLPVEKSLPMGWDEENLKQKAFLMYN